MGKQNHTPLLDEQQIAQLATDLSIHPAAVRAVLQAAGHELRERYRKRGWLPPKDGYRDRGPNNRGKSQRRATAIAYSQAQKAAARDGGGT